MTPEQKIIAIAEWEGWIKVSPITVPDRVWPCLSYVTGVDGMMMFPPAHIEGSGLVATSPPPYLTSRDAICGAVARLDYSQKTWFYRHLSAQYNRLTEPTDILLSEPSQLADALLLTLEYET